MNVKEYFSKIECNWTIEKKIPPKEYKIISVVFFYKENSYKKENIYLDGLKYIINKFRIIFPNFRLRIYHDNTTHNIIKNLINSSKNKDEIELYQYDIPYFREKNKQFHKGTIGTLIRFLPFYNFELHQVDETLVMDVDNKIFPALFKIYQEIKKNNIKFAYRFRYCYGFKKRLLCINDENIIEFPVIASTVFNLKTCPKEMFINFIDELYVKNDKKLIEFINSCDLIDKFEYGIDEIYINNYHLKYFYQEKLDISPIVFTDNTVANSIRTLLKNLSEDDIPNFISFLNEFFELLNFNLLDKKINKKELQDFLYQNKDKITDLSKQKFQSKELIDFLNKKLKNNQNKNQIDYYYFLTLKCLLNNFINVYPSKINLLKFNTDYKNNKTIIKNIQSFSLINL
jgi:hypothetical protein